MQPLHVEPQWPWPPPLHTVPPHPPLPAAPSPNNRGAASWPPPRRYAPLQGRGLRYRNPLARGCRSANGCSLPLCAPGSAATAVPQHLAAWPRLPPHPRRHGGASLRPNTLSLSRLPLFLNQLSRSTAFPLRRLRRGQSIVEGRPRGGRDGCGHAAGAPCLSADAPAAVGGEEWVGRERERWGLRPPTRPVSLYNRHREPGRRQGCGPPRRCRLPHRRFRFRRRRSQLLPDIP